MVMEFCSIRTASAKSSETPDSATVQAEEVHKACMSAQRQAETRPGMGGDRGAGRNRQIARRTSPILETSEPNSFLNPKPKLRRLWARVLVPLEHADAVAATTRSHRKVVGQQRRVGTLLRRSTTSHHRIWQRREQDGFAESDDM